MTLPIDSRELRRAFGQFGTGVTIVTTREPDGTPRGFTANSFSSVSLDPPLVLVCIAKSAASAGIFSNAPCFAVNVLAEDQKEASNVFATQRPDKFERVDWQESSNGIPLITGTLASFECSRFSIVEAGDHVILIGQVEAFSVREGRPLLYYRGAYLTLGFEAPLIHAASRQAETVLGGIFERDGAVLFEIDSASGTISLPSIGKNGDIITHSQLIKSLATFGIRANVDFVYAVFEEEVPGRVSIYYRGHADGETRTAMAFIPFDDIDLDRIIDPACRSMLTRYIGEARQKSFAVYMGNETEGVIRPVG